MQTNSENNWRNTQSKWMPEQQSDSVLSPWLQRHWPKYKFPMWIYALIHTVCCITTIVLWVRLFTCMQTNERKRYTSIKSVRYENFAFHAASIKNALIHIHTRTQTHKYFYIVLQDILYHTPIKITIGRISRGIVKIFSWVSRSLFLCACVFPCALSFGAQMVMPCWKITWFSITYMCVQVAAMIAMTMKRMLDFADAHFRLTKNNVLNSPSNKTNVQFTMYSV